MKLKTTVSDSLALSKKCGVFWVSRKWILAFVCLLSVALSSAALAKVEGRAQCCYLTQSGWSDIYTNSIDLISGMELSLIVPAGSVDSTKVYAGIWFGPGEVALVKLDDLIGLANFGPESLSMAESFAKVRDPLAPHLRGVDQSGRMWKIFLPFSTKLKAVGGAGSEMKEILMDKKVCVIAPSKSNQKEAVRVMVATRASLEVPKKSDLILVVVRSSLENPLIIDPKSFPDLREEAERQLNITGSIQHVYVYKITDDMGIVRVGHWSKPFSEE